MLQKLALVCSLLLAIAPNARAAECPPIWISQSGYTIWGPPDPDSPPNQTQLPDSLSQYGYVPAAAIHVVAHANGQADVIDTKAWCTDIAADPIANEAYVTNATVISRATGSFGDGSLAIAEQSSVSSGGLAAQSSALIQMGLRDVLQAHAAGTELVPITLHRHVSGVWTLDGGDGGTLDRLINRAFVMTIWERTAPSGPQSWTRRLVIDDQDLDLLNGDESYLFEVLPGKDLILSLYSYGMGSCIGDQTFGDPPASYPACYGFMDFGGGGFGSPITFDFEPGPGVSLTSAGGFTQYVPEPSEGELGEVACAGLVATLAMRRRRA